MYKYKVTVKQTIFGKIEVEFDSLWQAMEYIRISLDNDLKVEIARIN